MHDNKTEAQEVETLWTEKCSVTSFKVLSSNTEDRSMQIIEGSLLINELLSDYKASLAAEIEEIFKDQSTRLLFSKEHLLTLLETCKPLEK